MIFTRLHSTDSLRITSIEILDPVKSKNYEYFYPDGIRAGFWGRYKTYFCKEVIGDEYFENVEDALKKSGSKSLFIQKGQIYEKGILRIFLGDEICPIEFYFESKSEIKDYLDSLEFKFSIPLNDFVCLQTKEIETLYEYKEKIS